MESQPPSRMVDHSRPNLGKVGTAAIVGPQEEWEENGNTLSQNSPLTPQPEHSLSGVWALK